VSDQQGPVEVGQASFEVLNDSGTGPWLASLLPMVHQLSVSASYESVFVGSGFVTSADGNFVTARHVAVELLKYWDYTRKEAVPAALYVLDTYLIQISGLNLPPEDPKPSDLATGKLALPAGPNGELQQMPFLEPSREPVKVGDRVTMVGHARLTESVLMDDAKGSFSNVGQFTAITDIVTEVLPSVSNINAPVFKLECELPGGMSGGPIFRESTYEVAGVCAYGLVTDDDESYCYGSMLDPLWQPFGKWPSSNH
jgi:hypothetical protein